MKGIMIFFCSAKDICLQTFCDVFYLILTCITAEYGLDIDIIMVIWWISPDKA